MAKQKRAKKQRALKTFEKFSFDVVIKKLKAEKLAKNGSKFWVYECSALTGDIKDQFDERVDPVETTIFINVWNFYQNKLLSESKRARVSGKRNKWLFSATEVVPMTSLS